MEILSLNPFLTKKVLDEIGLSGKLYVRARDLEEFSRGFNYFGVFVDPYYDGDKLTSFVSDFSAKNKRPIIVSLYDDLKKTGEINSTYNQTPIEYIENIGLLDREIKILGGIYADKDDFSVMASYGAKMIICPYESLNLGRGSPNLLAMINAGLDIEMASPLLNDMSKEIEIISVVSRGILSDESVLPIKEVEKLSISSQNCIEIKEKDGAVNQEELEKILNKIKEKILCR